MPIREREVVAALEQALIQRIGEPRYNLWFTRNTKLTWDDDLLIVGVPNHFFQEWLESTFGEAVRAAASDALCRPMRVRFAIDPELFQAARRQQAAVSSAECGAQSAELQALPHDTQSDVCAPRSAPRAPRSQRRWHRLSDFIVGACNRMAHAAAFSVAEAPGQSVNPLVLYGPVGTGKTHLLEGIYAAVRKDHSELPVCFITSEDFTHQFVQAMRLGKLGSFRKRFRECAVLLIDDLNFLAGKKATQEEFLHTFDVLLADGKQIVATCDSHPRLTEEFSPELTDRLLGGAIWSLLPPDEPTRLEILRAKARQGEPPIPDDVLRLAAARLHGNVRELEGAIYSIRHYSRVAGRAVDVSLAREALADLIRHSVRVLSLEQVDRAICRALHLPGGALQAKQRAWAVSHPRMLAMYLARKHTAAAYSEVGRYFGGRNHSTVLAAEKKVRTWLAADVELALGERRWRVREIVELIEREMMR